MKDSGSTISVDQHSTPTSPSSHAEEHHEISGKSKEKIPHNKIKHTMEHTKYILSIIILQFILVGCFLVIGIIYGWLHKIPDTITLLRGKGVETYYDAIAHFNFVGVSDAAPDPSIFAVICEVGIWSFFGILARSEYYLTQLVLQHRRVPILEMISKIIGEVAMGVFTAVAVVAFLWSTEFVNLTLRTADIGSIMAISFILGFYHENTRRLLGSLNKTLSEKSQETKITEEEESAGEYSNKNK